MSLVKGDWVITSLEEFKGKIGSVKRIAKNGSWADVEWKNDDNTKTTRRIIIENLQVVTIIDLSEKKN